MKLVIILNPFQRQERKIFDIPFKNESLETILKAIVLKSKDLSLFTYDQIKEGVRISINGLVIPSTHWGFHKPVENDEIVFMPIVAKGDSEKEILNIAIMIAVVVAIGPEGVGLLGAGAGAGAAVAGLAIIAGTGMLLQALTPSPGAKGFAPDDWENSQVYSWSPQSTQKQGIVRPKFYGKNKLYGNAIAVHTEIDDNDDTKQTLKLLLGLGDGPVKGIVDGSIKINGQNVENYTDIITEERFGTLDQTPISFFTEVKPEFRPNRLVTNSGGAIIWTTPDADFTNLEIELLWDRGLYFANNQGGLSDHTIGIKIEISEADAASWNILAEESITDATTSLKRKNYIASETYTGGSPVTINEGTAYDIRITKTSSDQSSTRYGDSLRLGSVREVLQDQFEYPKLSLLGIEALATDQLSGSVNVSCIQESAIVNVFNGSTWTLEYSTNPAWVLFDIFTQPVISGDGESGTPYTIERYDGTDPSNMDIDVFFELAVFCSQADIPDGQGGTEERITFNGGFDIGTSVWEAALKVCEIARCIPIWKGSDLTLAIDKADTPVQMFNVANIDQDSFKEMFMPQSELISEIEVQYRDEEQDFKRVPFVILNENVPNATRRIVLELFGVTKQSEAWRAGKHRLNQNEFLKSVISFKADIDSINSTIGNVILVQHDVPDWGKGGRIISGPTTTSIIVSKDMVYTSGAQHEVNLRKSDDTLNQNFLTTSKYNDIIGVTPGSNEFEIDGDFTDEYKDQDSIRIEDSTGNDNDYTLDGDPVFGGGITTITVNETIPDATVDGGLFNLRRIVVNTPFLNSSSVAELAEEFDIYIFGVQNLNAREYRILHLRQTSEQYITITAVIYDENVYASDGDDPIITLDEGLNNPQSDNDNLLVDYVGAGQVNNVIPQFIRGVPFIDIPMTTNLQWDGSGGDTVAWSAADGVNPILFTLNGIPYEITPGNSTKEYIYWDPNFTTVFRETNVLADVLVQGRWLMAYNDLGTIAEAFGEKIIHGAVIQAGTITAAKAQIANAAIGEAQIANLAVTQAKIGNLAVTSAKIGNLEVKSANIENLTVGTGKVANAATTVNAFDDGGDTELSDSFQSVASASITSVGGVIVINFSGYLDMTTAAIRNVQIEIRIGATVLWSDTKVSVGSTNLIGVAAPCSDQPGSGSRTYTVYAKHTSTAVTLHMRKARLTIEETKK